MSKKQKISIVLLLILLIAIGGVAVLYFLKKEDTKSNIVKQEDIIKEYNYTLKETDSKLKKEKFKELKQILTQSDVDFEEYAKTLAEIFVLDVYDLSYKVNKYNVGGLEYVLEEKQETFKMILQDSLYNNLKDNTDNNRNQELPIISGVKVDDFKTGSYLYEEVDYDAYIVDISIDYKKDLGYDKNISIKMIKKGNKLFVVQVNPY